MFCLFDCNVLIELIRTTTRQRTAQSADQQQCHDNYRKFQAAE